MSASSIFQPSPPDVAIEIDATHVAAARWSSRGAAANHVSEPLPPGAVLPSLAAPNVVDGAALTRSISQALTRLGGRVSRAALVIPDTAGKVSLIRFENVPADSADLAELVRWQVRKSAPFPIEQAVVSFSRGIQAADGSQEYIVTTARADTVAEYEQACARAGVHAGLVDIATFSIINGVLAGASVPTGDPSTGAGSSRAPSKDDWLLVHATASYTTLAVLRGEDVIFFRNREHDSEGTLGDVVHQTAMYYEDRLKGSGFSRVLLAGGAVQGVDAVRQSLEQRLEVRIESVAQPELASLLGILARERLAA
jgi:Tfp pilus assembly PilM family ATPase